MDLKVKQFADEAPAVEAPIRDVEKGSHEDATIVHHGSAQYYGSVLDVPLEELIHYARIQRRTEETDGGYGDGVSLPHDNDLVARKTPSAFRKSQNVLQDLPTPPASPSGGSADEKKGTYPLSEGPSDQEYLNAARALRMAKWSSVFFLITTDILGPFNAPFALSQVGWVPGVILYTVMGIMAFYTGILLWRLYLRLDSARYPIRTYGDMAEFLIGTWARHLCTVLQTLQLIVNVGILCLGNGQILTQIIRSNALCFAVAVLLWPLVGMVIGQIRTLKNYGFLANSAVWFNLLIIFTGMGFVSHSPPNYRAAMASLGVPEGPVITEAFTHLPLYNKINGIMNMVFAYGGAMIFPEILAEMRRPYDFWKGMACAQVLIYCAYLMYGCFIYGYQGQFSLPLAYQGVSKYGWQTLGNVLALITGIIAAGLYGNIGLKVLYIQVIEKVFHGPPLMSKRGRLVWSPLVVIYWSLAYVVGCAIPQIANISGLIAAICILQFTYSFPPVLRLAYDIQTDAMTGDRPYVAGSGFEHRVDTWKDASRWKRGILSGNVLFKSWNLVFALASFTTAALGMYGSGTAISEAFKVSAATSFGCDSPVL